MNKKNIKIAIVDYGMGNVFSIMRACEFAGMSPFLTDSARELVNAHAIILPGVGAFGDAMNALKKSDLITPLKEIADAGKYLIGICLGMQLLMDESYEHGNHKGLGIISGRVVRLNNAIDNQGNVLKVPHVGWNKILRLKSDWSGTLLDLIQDEAYMYFVHSFYVVPDRKDVFLSESKYGANRFCSSLAYGKVIGFQFHPERSGPEGLKIYKKLKMLIDESYQSGD